MGCRLSYEKYMGKKIIASIITLALGLPIVLLVYRMIYDRWFSEFELDFILSPVDVVGLIVTLGVTVSIAWFISKKITSDRYFVEYVIQDLKAIHSELEELQSKVDYLDELDLITSARHYSRMITLFKRYNSTLKIEGVEPEEHLSSIDKLYAKLTDVDGSVLVIDSVMREEIDVKIAEAIIEIRVLMFNMNKK